MYELLVLPGYYFSSRARLHLYESLAKVPCMMMMMMMILPSVRSLSWQYSEAKEEDKENPNLYTTLYGL